MNWKERKYCGSLSASDSGKGVLLMGWVDAIRDHGNLLFIHLRDISGIVQIVFSSEENRVSYDMASSLREEYVVEVRGPVCMREKGTENPNLSTGYIEVKAQDLVIHARSKTPPFRISEKAMVLGEETKPGTAAVDEDLRLKYRYLDLRRPSMQEMFKKRYEINRVIRQNLHKHGFCEIETPFLTKSTPEGARDYLVPSRVHQGKFYALPQSPQLFKQLLMISGMDRYFQIARCFRDEDLRPNRQPEFTQLDLEASFIDEEFIYELIEELITEMFAVGNIDLKRPFPRMSYDTAMDKYGCDRPDLRFGMEFQDLTGILADTQYSIFRNIISKKGTIKGFCVKGCGDILSKNMLQNEYTMKIVPSMGAKGMTWMKMLEGRLQSNIVQFFTEEELHNIIKLFNAQNGDVLMMIADTSKELVNRVLSELRLHVAKRLDLIPFDTYRPLWVTDFPLFELKDNMPSSQHHPFTMPDRTDFDPSNIEELLSLKSRAYDIVMNGEELGGGSIRINDMEIQDRIFKALGLSRSEADAKFGFFLKALEYGAPPHAGLALGLDRVTAMILNTPSIRDVIAFPKNRRAYCPLTQAPSLAAESQLEELGLNIASQSAESSKSDTAESETKKKVSDRISLNEVRHVAGLARLKLSDDEAKRYRADLNNILDYVQSIEELNTNDIPPMNHAIETGNVWREDIPRQDADGTDLLKNAPEREKDYFKVPRIMEGN